MQNYIDQLNEAQRAPVLQKDGPMIVIAGAGSGKTRVLTLRIAYLMHQGVDAFNILALTFTNKAAREMKVRIAQIVGNSEAKNLWMGTFHSVFAKILRAEADKLGYPSNFTIYDSQDSQRLIGQIIKEMQLDKDIYKPKEILSRISSYKNSLVTVKAYFNNPELQEADAMSKRPRIGEIYNNYVERCFKSGAMDFDDLLLKTNELLTRFPDVLSKYQNRFKYILVDEYQDTNHSQYLIVRALSDRFQNICVVGDDAQSIYAFRGANINNILNFQKDYEGVETYRLEQNYRSSRNIVEAANSVIDNNKVKLEKVVWTANDFGPKIKVHRSLTDGEEGRFVASTIFEEKMQNQKNNSDFAILYRTNAQSRAMEDALRKKDIPYRIYGGLSFYQRKEIKDVLSYLRLVINPKDEEALVRVINYPARGIGNTTLDKLTIAANHYKRSIFEVVEHIDKIDLKITAGTRNKLSDFSNMIKAFQALEETMDAYQLTEHIVKKTGLVQEMRKDTTPEGITRMENIEELLNGIKDFIDGQREVDGARGALSEFMEDVALATDLDKDTGDDDRVALMTIHLAKGLEFPTVFCVGMEEDLFPSAMSMNTRSELEEERRLFYVALTRAEHQAYLTYAQSRYRWGKLVDSDPSRFIEEIKDEYLEYLTPIETNYRYKPTINADIFGDVDKSKLRLKKPVAGTPPAYVTDNEEPKENRNIRKLKPVDASPTKTTSLTNGNQLLEVGQVVMHERFGKGVIINLEGVGADKKAEIRFDVGGIKKLLLRFAKLQVL
ncbi:UvrD-helicase domain-containing protein [Myroides odoratimimus]|uniref:DNA 3'-5' helicase n=1 Tax=Myroides odoratimimus TaxID=76832 RepID=A0AAI8G5Q6_9FLAO|nr:MULTISPECIES: UvrD-helicase domain-containing protein [Myroides]ALU26991.1 ATP-dependent DNA helicase [Myroides odoratimimus]MCA4806377.1 UvrD-helicase domain-containing protein [Myroides odoratimimus]MCO7722325.1 UvrD-helicase domain-containing protein [Myroides odoratimimus]MDM1085458.1 UvrD-helicase domain-containing protein [Myroides odoratimimus]MDM1093350.1 UvrD-helicase domain-containing protein [Myroides odoratimimus]